MWWICMKLKVGGEMRTNDCLVMEAGSSALVSLELSV